MKSGDYMSMANMIAVSESAGVRPSRVRGSGKTRDLHVKGVPEEIWCHARCNATLSGMSFKDYLIALLETSTPRKDKS